MKFSLHMCLGLVFSVILSHSVFAKPFEDFKSIGMRSGSGFALYYHTRDNLSANACNALKDTAKLMPSEPVGTICQKTCDRIFVPNWFTAFIAVKNLKGTFQAVPFEGDWDKVFFCGWNPEAGVSDREIKQAGIASHADVVIANQVCKRGTDPNMVLVIGAINKNQCFSDCQKCPVSGLK